MPRQRIIDRIEAKRRELGLSVRDLSVKSGVPESTYNNMIHGRTQSYDWGRLRALAIAVDLSPVEFMDLLDDEQSTPVAESLQKEREKIATGYDIDYLADTFVRTNDKNSEDFRRALESKDAQFDKEREAFRETIASKQQHIKDISDLLSRYSVQIRRLTRAVIVLALLCCTLLGIMVAMFTNNTSLRTENNSLHEIIASYVENNE